MAAITLAGGEVGVLRAQFWSLPAVAVLGLACVAGLGMSYFSFALRAVISATSFSVIGNVCKVLTILVNLLMWDNHASAPLTCPAGNVCVRGDVLHWRAVDLVFTPWSGCMEPVRAAASASIAKTLALKTFVVPLCLFLIGHHHAVQPVCHDTTSL